MKTILAAIDFSPISRRVERAAIDLARALGARVVLFHAVVPPAMIAPEMVPWDGRVADWSEVAEKAAVRHLRRVQRGWAHRGVAIETMCAAGLAAPLVLNAARKVAASHIVLGSHGHMAFRDLVAGSTASVVLKRACCPVVVVPPAKKRPLRRRST